MKYLNLLKNNYKVNDDEIRFILISTEWEELINPFTELSHQTDISIKGYKIEWKEGKITSKREVKPLKKTKSERTLTFEKRTH